jgi:hypothetical protein
MNKYSESLLGFSPAAFIRGMRFGLRDALRSSRKGFIATHPMVNRYLRTIPTRYLEEILGKRSSLITLCVMRYEDGTLPTCDAIGLLSLLVAEKPQEVLEIGTYMGSTTRAMAENLPEAIIHTIDLPIDFKLEADEGTNIPKDDFHLIKERIVGKEFKGQPCETRIIQHFGDTAHFDFAELGRPTFFFIDGSHTYEYCKNDSEKCLALCGGKGTFLWHDCDDSHEGVNRFIQEWRALGRDVVRIEGTALAYWKSS